MSDVSLTTLDGCLAALERAYERAEEKSDAGNMVKAVDIAVTIHQKTATRAPLDPSILELLRGPEEPAKQDPEAL